MYEGDVADRYVRALVAEIAVGLVPAHDGQPRDVRDGQPRGLPLQDEPRSREMVDTIYFGGGTPSLLSTNQTETILKAVHDRFIVAEAAEVTLEINPGDGGVTADDRRQTMREWRRLGINRASFGAQTFDDRELKMLGRTHDSADVRTTFQLLREAGFDNVNFDLIAGLPGQTIDGWKRNLEQALQLRPEHLSLYLLDVHEGTPLHDQINRGMRPKPDDDLAAEMYAFMIDEMAAAGYEHYEISNFCLPGFTSRHNSKYWSGAPYYGFGNSAHSYDGARRRWANQRDATKYVEMVDRGESPVIERTELSEEDAQSEAIFLGLRLMKGINLQNYRARFGRDLRAEFNGELDRLSEAGLIEVDSEVLKLTSRGALLSNEVFAALA
jgi:oxygen-independent coproporphyrinogen-3 oxidase